MPTVINAKTLRDQLAEIMQRVRKGECFTVLYRSRPACRIVPVDADGADVGDLEDDPLYRAAPLGGTSDGKTAADHDELLYGQRPR